MPAQLEPDLNPISVTVMVLTAVMGPELAQVAGAYTIILMGWFGGLIWGALRLPAGGRFKLVLLCVLSLILTLGITVPLAEFVSNNAARLGGWEFTSKGLLFPIAVAIPAIGHSWPDLFAWAWRIVSRRLAPTKETGQ